MRDLETQVRGELNQVLSVLQELTDLRSHWNGALKIVPGAGFNGSKSFSCIIRIDETLARQDIRWRTLIHEALHTVSVGFSRMEYDEVPGWEEGVVEQLQRLLRPTILSRLGVSVAEEVFHQEEASHLYNEYIEALENIRQKLEKPPIPFYIDLLATPIKNRSGTMFGLGSRLAGDKRRDFLQAFSEANSVLKDEASWIP